MKKLTRKINYNNNFYNKGGAPPLSPTPTPPPTLPSGTDPTLASSEYLNITNGIQDSITNTLIEYTIPTSSTSNVFEIKTSYTGIISKFFTNCKNTPITTTYGDFLTKIREYCDIFLDEDIINDIINDGISLNMYLPDDYTKLVKLITIENILSIFDIFKFENLNMLYPELFNKDTDYTLYTNSIEKILIELVNGLNIPNQYLDNKLISDNINRLIDNIETNKKKYNTQMDEIKNYIYANKSKSWFNKIYKTIYKEQFDSNFKYINIFDTDFKKCKNAIIDYVNLYKNSCVYNISVVNINYIKLFNDQYKITLSIIKKYIIKIFTDIFKTIPNVFNPNHIVQSAAKTMLILGFRDHIVNHDVIDDLVNSIKIEYKLPTPLPQITQCDTFTLMKIEIDDISTNPNSEDIIKYFKTILKFSKPMYFEDGLRTIRGMVSPDGDNKIDINEFMDLFTERPTGSALSLIETELGETVTELDEKVTKKYLKYKQKYLNLKKT
jgi:hypothetical protein